jgi:hypothetical protein
MAPCDVITCSRVAARDVISGGRTIRRTRKRQSTRACTRRGSICAPGYGYTLVRPSPFKKEYATSRKKDAGVAQEMPAHTTAPEPEEAVTFCEASRFTHQRGSRANKAIEASDPNSIKEYFTLSRKRVHFDLAATSMHEVVPYSEIYDAHPRTFVFDQDSEMIPAARGGYVSAASMEDPPDELDDEDDGLEDDEDHDSCEDEDEDDGGWESWLVERENDDDPDDYACMLDKEMLLVQENEIMIAQVPLQDIQICLERRHCQESEHERESPTHGNCLPDLDDETQWESWLEATLGSTQDIFYDPNLCPSQ